MPNSPISGRLPVVGLLALALLLGSLSGCGADGSSSTTTLPRVKGDQASATRPPAVTAWAAAPDPCSLVTVAEVKAVTGFEPVVGAKETSTETGAPTTTCLFANPNNNLQSGYLTVTILPPGGRILENRSSFTEVQELEGIGNGAVIGHYGGGSGIGSGPNVGVVDMGNGGLSIGALISTQVSAEQMRSLLTSAAGRWQPKPS